MTIDVQETYYSAFIVNALPDPAVAATKVQSLARQQVRANLVKDLAGAGL